MKKTLNTLLIIILLILIKLVFSFSINEIIIYNYNHNNYNSTLVKFLHIFNYYQPYISYYNEGNILYKKENYTEAIIKYNKAINKNPPQKKVCDIRINLSLAMIRKIDSNDIKIVYNELEKAKENLYNNNCAHSTDNNGYSKEAKTLEQEIIILQNLLTTSTNNTPSNKEDDTQQDDDTNIEDELKKLEKKSKENRQEDLSKYQDLDNFSYYSGKKW